MCVLTLLNNDESNQNVTFGSQHIKRKLSKVNKTNDKPLNIENTYLLTEAMRKVMRLRTFNCWGKQYLA